MRQREQLFWDRMRKACAKRVHLQRVENLCAVGMPDVVALARGVVTWCENKAVEAYPARDTTPVLGDQRGLSQDQKNWHLEWKRWGGRSIIAVGVGLDLYVIPGSLADEVNAFSRGQLAMNAVARDFPGLIRILRGENPADDLMVQREKRKEAAALCALKG